MSAERPCPSCGVPGRSEKGDLVLCAGCGSAFFAPDWTDEAAPLAPAEAPPLSAPVVFLFHAGVLAAELLLASLVIGVFVGLPALGIAWLAGAGFWR